MSEAGGIKAASRAFSTGPGTANSDERPTRRKCCATVGGEPHTAECESLWRATREFPPATEPKGLTDADLAYLREHRAIVICEVHPDSTGTQHVWLVSPEQAEHVADFLGKPEQTTIVPAGSLLTLMDIAEGLPSYDHD